MPEWEKYYDDRLIKRCEGYVVIKPIDHVNPPNLFCSVCDTLIDVTNDENAVERFGCCEQCANTWAYKNSEKWENGWRPEPNEVATTVNNRPKRNVVIT
jgi:hypothetical protein